MNTNGRFAPIVEALILSSPEPLPPRKIADVIEELTFSEVENAIAELNNKYMQTDSSFRIRKIAGGYQHYIIENYAAYIEELNVRRRSTRLSRAALETMAIIAYRQPVTKTDVEMIRGVSSDSSIHTLLEKKLITLAGRAETVGRPLLYKTTDEFLKFFNLNSHDDLPRMEEIEELISSKEPDNQESLPLGPFVNPHTTNGIKAEHDIKLTIRQPEANQVVSPMYSVKVNLPEPQADDDDELITDQADHPETEPESVEPPDPDEIEEQQEPEYNPPKTTTDEEQQENRDPEPEPVGVVAEYDANPDPAPGVSEPVESRDHATEQDPHN